MKTKDNQYFIVSALVGAVTAVSSGIAAAGTVAAGAAGAGVGTGTAAAVGAGVGGAAAGLGTTIGGAAGAAGAAATGAAATGASAATSAAGLGAAASGLGTAISLGSQGYQLYAGMQAAEASQEAEAIRKQQMQFEATQARLRTMREFRAAQASTESNIANSGMDNGTGSIQGSQGGAYATFSTNTNQANTGESLGLQMFQANSDYSQATGAYKMAGGVSDFAQNVGFAASPLARVGMSLFNPNRFSA